jgi:hypothetical protein
LLEIEAPWLLRLVARNGGDIVMIKGSDVDVMDVVDAKVNTLCKAVKARIGLTKPTATPKNYREIAYKLQRNQKLVTIRRVKLIKPSNHAFSLRLD